MEDLVEDPRFTTRVKLKGLMQPGHEVNTV